MLATRGIKPPPGAQLNRGHPLAQGMVLCFPFNEAGGRPIDLVAGRSLTTKPTWVNSRWGPALDVDSAGSGFYAISNPVGLNPPNPFRPWAGFALLDFGDRSTGTASAVLDFVFPPNGSHRFTFNYEVSSNANLGASKSTVVDMAAGTAPPAGKAAVTWQFASDTSLITCVDGAITTNSNTTAFATNGDGSSYAVIGRDSAKFRIAALYMWHRRLLSADEMLLLNTDPFCMIGTHPNRGLSLGGGTPAAWHTSLVKVWK